MSGAGTPLEQHPSQIENHHLLSRLFHRLLAFWWGLIVVVVVGLLTNILLIPLSQGLDQFWPHVKSQIAALYVLLVTQPLPSEGGIALFVILTMGGFLAHRHDKKLHQQRIKVAQESINRQASLSDPSGSTTLTFHAPIVDESVVVKEGRKDEYHGPVFQRGSIIVASTLDLLSNLQESESPLKEIPSQIWHVPYQHKPYFTGREDILQRLHTELTIHNIAVISGLDGLGKTQTAVEYACRFRDEYQAVFWVQAETRDHFINDMVRTAGILHLPERNEPQAALSIAAVKQWLEGHSPWLLVLDNVGETAFLEDLLPTQQGGHLLLLSARPQTTRHLAQAHVLEPLSPIEGMRFLHQRVRLHTSVTPRLIHLATWQLEAQELSELLGGVPLALEQAGAYIKDVGCSVRRYQQHYRTLLRSPRSTPGRRHNKRYVAGQSEIVAITSALALTEVKQRSSVLAELLYSCAFLAAEAIPLDLFSAGAPALGSRLQKIVNTPEWDAAITTLQAFSLLDAYPQTETLRLHHLVQEFLREDIGPHRRTRWIERTVQFVNQAFPRVEMATWESCQRYLPQALACIRHIEQRHLRLLAAGQLLHKVGRYYYERAQNDQALPLLVQARDILEPQVEKEDPELLSILSTLAAIYHEQGQLAEAVPLLEHVVEIQQEQPDQAGPALASTLNSLAAIHQEQGKLDEALPLLEQALAIEDQQMELEDPARTLTLTSIATIYQEQGRSEEALDVLEHLRTLQEEHAEQEDPALLHRMATIYLDQGKTDEALLLLQKALVLVEQQTRAESLDLLLQVLKSLVVTYHILGQEDQEPPLLQRVLEIQERQLGPNAPELVPLFVDLAECLHDLKRYEEALTPLHRALIIREQHGEGNPPLVRILRKLSLIYRDLGRFEQGLPLLKQVLTLQEEQLGPDHVDQREILTNLAVFYQLTEQYQDAADCLQRVLQVQEHHFGGDHLEVASSLHDLAILYYRFQGRFDEALPLLQRALAIRTKLLGPEHDDVAFSWRALGNLYRAQADAVDTKARAILEKNHPGDEPSTNVEKAST